MPDKPNVALFYDVTPENFHLLDKHLEAGDRIVLLDLNHNYKQVPFLRELIDAGKAEWVICQFREIAEGKAIDLIDVHFSKFETLVPYVKSLGKLIGCSAASDVFRKIVCPLVAHCFVIDDVISTYLSKDSTQKVKVYGPQSLKNTLEVMKECGHSFSYFVDILIYRSSSLSINYMRKKLINFLYFFGLSFKGLLSLLSCMTPRFTKKAKNEHLFYINQPSLLDYKGYRGFDFIIDEGEFRKQNSLFVTSFKVRPSLLSSKSEEGYQFIEISNFFNSSLMFSSSLMFKNIFRFFAFLISVIGTLFNDIQLTRSLLSVGNTWLNWHLITDGRGFKNFIYSNSDGYQQYVVNEVLKENGVKSWYYSLFLGGRYMYASTEKELSNHRNILWSFQNMDYHLGVNDTVGKAYRLHKQRNVQYYSVGSIYSDLIIKASRENSKLEFFKEMFKKDFDESYKLISIFDVACMDHESIPVTYEDALLFYEDILKLIQENENYYAVFKPQKSDDFYIDPRQEWSSMLKGPGVIEARKRLINHERVYNANLEADNCLIMGLSDLVITQCASSPNVEALGALKRAFWYESRPRREGFLFDQIPKLRIDGYDNLKSRSKELLTMDEKTLEEYLSSVKPLLLSDNDGASLEQFKKIIKEENARNHSI